METNYAQTTLLEKAHLVAWLSLLPFYLAWKLLTGIASPKPWTRICTECLSRFCTDHLAYNQIQWLQPDTLGIFKRWTNNRGIETTVEDLPSGGRLLWMGPKRLDRVILYVHGGGFVFPLSEFALAFWNYVCAQLDVPVGMVFLAYSLYPEAKYPDQLCQARDALSFLLESGVKPERLHIAGESAGGNIVLQLLSHILHPHPSVEPLPSDLHFAGVFLMSPWVWLGDPGGKDEHDIISSRSLRLWGSLILKDVPEDELPYVEPYLACFDGLHQRLLITSGGKEGMAETHRKFKDMLKDVTFLVDEEGLHDSLMYDFSLTFLQRLQRPRVGKDTAVLVQWLVDGFDASNQG